MPVSGRLLHIHDKRDNNGINPRYFIRKSKKALTMDKIITTENEWGHGLLFEPRKAWLEQVVKWREINN